MRLLMALPVAVALAWTPALAEEEKQPPTEKVICKRTQTTSYTGSHLGRPKKTCMRASEWKELENEKDRTLRQIQDGRLSPDQPAAMGGGPG